VTRKLLLIAILACSALAAAAPARAQASLTKAKELYASANYDEALTMLNSLGGATDENDSAAVAMYRVLCLVAVGRTSEVDTAIDRLVSQHPLYRPASDELSPRIQKAVSSARVRLLPNLVQRRYEESKSAYDRGDFAASKVGFKWVLTALSDPDISYLAAQSPLADIKTLSTGFVDLSEKALAPPPPALVSAPAPTPAILTMAPPPSKPTRDLKRVFSAEDTDVVAPITTKQLMPRFPGLLKQAAAGVLELVIDSTGAVESVKLIEPVDVKYDSLLMTAAKKWQYQPAQLDGAPVRYMKRIQVSLAPEPAAHR